MSTKSFGGKPPLRGVPPLKVRKVASEKPLAGRSTHPPIPPSRGAGGSVGPTLRSHPRWKAFLKWELVDGHDDQTAEFYADAKMCKWLKAQEAKEKDLCEKNDGQLEDS
ncbi:hypothetical protein ES703_35103 [subsurface metagenome]